MGDLATPEALILRWEEVLRDPSLQDLPYKIELNVWGKIEMSPASVRHGWLQAALAAEFTQPLRDGVTLTECPILTGIGVRVPDVVWASARFMREHRGLSPLPRAPEICVETLSRSNVEAEIGEKTQSRFPVAAVLPDPTKGYP
jgi:hypothetical protein